MNRILFFFVIGALLVFLAAMFHIGSDEQLKDVIENHLAKFIIAKTLFSFFVSILWTLLSYCLYRLVFMEDKKRIPFGRFFLVSIAGYLILSLCFALVFIYIAM